MISGIFPGTGAVNAAVDTFSHKGEPRAQDVEGKQRGRRAQGPGKGDEGMAGAGDASGALRLTVAPH